MNSTANISGDITMRELLAQFPGAQRALFRRYHIGGCASCAVDEEGSLAQAVRERGADLDSVLTALNTLPANGGMNDLRMPNVRFDG